MREVSTNVVQCSACEEWQCVNCNEPDECDRCMRVFCIDCFTDAESHSCWPAIQREQKAKQAFIDKVLK